MDQNDWNEDFKFDKIGTKTAFGNIKRPDFYGLLADVFKERHPSIDHFIVDLASNKPLVMLITGDGGFIKVNLWESYSAIKQVNVSLETAFHYIFQNMYSKYCIKYSLRETNVIY